MTSPKNVRIRRMPAAVRCFLLLLLFYGTLAAQEQERHQKPVLIRADVTKEPVEEVVQHDPLKAQRSLEVGDFYFKRRNFKAARDRYREAIRYNNKLALAYSKLVRTLEKMKEFSQAIEVCSEFIENNPDSGKLSDFEKKAAHLRQRHQNVPSRH